MTLQLTSFQKTALLVGAVLFDFLFWNQLQGLNLLLWLLFLSGFVAGENPEALRSPYFRAALLSAVFSAGCAAWYGSGVAKLAAWVSLGLLVGWANQPPLRLVSNALLTALGKLDRTLIELAGMLRHPRLGSLEVRRAWYYGRLLGLPLVALLVFHLLFVMANPRYAALTISALDWFGNWLEWFLDRFSVPHLVFFLFGLLLTASALLRIPFGKRLAREVGRVEVLRRIRRPRTEARAGTSPLALRREYLAAIAAFGLLNALLAVVNGIDIQWLWFGFRPAPDFDLAQFVHEGTWVLIISILLAMALVLFFFRRNLNFYAPGLRRLRPLATLWVGQNAVLAISVGLRNYYYISAMGLAYKRIGVYCFLALVLFGLTTVLLKIWQQRSAFALVRLNGLAAWALLLVLAAGNWESWIVGYNLQARFRPYLDQRFLVQMPDRVLPLLAQHPNAFPDQLQELQTRLTEFRQTYPQRDWQSWNYADWQAYRTLTTAARPPLPRP